MNPDKKFIVDELLERVNESPFILVVDYTGMTVPQFADLRGEALDEAQLNTIATIPSRDALLGQLLSVINGPAAAVARVIDAKYNAGGEEAAAE